MRKICVIFYLILISLSVYASDTKEVTENDTSEVISLNNAGYANRLNNARQTIADADNALRLALKIGYTRGVAESYRIKGIGEYYLNRPDSAINRYYESLNQYEKIGDQMGMANVYNNIGNLYQMIDYEKALDNFTKAFIIAEKF